ncbi:premelanosome protein b [Chanos chanos]|uniref:Premelanosome protein b n=1 Tax=Chanos chanos TaxID=29144 RepID=A0A6J2UW35_CHACN|nr:melanocyte protein PMEL-like [Chanos chanos]
MALGANFPDLRKVCQTYYRVINPWLSHLRDGIQKPTTIPNNLSIVSGLTGDHVKFDVGNDAPTLTGAKITFTIEIIFPTNQVVLPDGQVVWAEDCTINGTHYRKRQPVYPEDSSVDEWNGVFPDGTTLSEFGDKRPPYVFVWKTWGQYWQVCDGPSSSLTIDTHGVPLGSYMMDVVIYHYRKKDKFIPLGYASTQFCITDQIPFSVELSQVNDIDEGDERFVQNRAVAFTITLHDPSQYLKDSDVTFNWDFGDSSGTVISRELTVTHTYINTGSFKPQVVIQAAIPDPGCATPSDFSTTISPTSQTSDQITRAAAGLSADRTQTLGTQKVKVVEKRQAPVREDCVIYRYGSFSTDIEVVEGIESVDIVQVTNGDTGMTLDLEDNAVDFTISCQGSLPTRVCTVVSDADCISPIKTVCNSVTLSPECQLVIRHFFNDSGVFCINVSLTNDVSLALTSARVSVNIDISLFDFLWSDSRLNPTVIVAMALGLLIITSVVGIGSLTYKHLKGYHPLIKVPFAGESDSVAWRSAPALRRNLVIPLPQEQKHPLFLHGVV